MHKQEAKPKSPIKEPSLPYAGDSTLDRAIKQLAWFTIGILLFTASLTAVLGYFFEHVLGLPQNTILSLIIGIPALIAGICVMVAAFKRLRNTMLGMIGERSVAESLSELGLFGYRILHDIEFDHNRGKSNIDHVLIGPEGVFVLETKSLRKRPGRGQQIEHDGESVFVNGRKLPRNPIPQTRAAADAIRKQLGVFASSCPVKPVVLFPGWFVKHGYQRETWVLNPKVLVSRLKEPKRPCLDEQRREEIYHLLSQIQRTRSLRA